MDTQKYKCSLCNYLTNDRCSWYSHKKSKKHKHNENISELESKMKHNNSTSTEILNKSHEVELLRERLKAAESEKNMIREQLTETKKQFENTGKEYEKRIEEIKEHLETLKFENQFQKQLINSAGGIIKKSMNTLSYLLLNYRNAPHITELSDYSILSKNTDDLIKSMTFYYNKNRLDKYIGDFIIKHYKKQEPEQQSLWSSDTDRLNYFICEFLKQDKKNDKKQWILDKKGIKMSRYVIKPLLDYIYGINSVYINDKNKEIGNFGIEQFNKTEKILKELHTLASINADIKNSKLSNEINKYIAPHFYFDKTQSIDGN